jgi:hypothetical protein
MVVRCFFGFCTEKEKKKIKCKFNKKSRTWNKLEFL